jgi:hypothetical protein
MGQANSRTNNESETRTFSPPDQFKFSKVQALKLTVIQAAFSHKPLTEGETTAQEEKSTTISRASSFSLVDPQEIFMSTVSTLIVGLNRGAESDPSDSFNKNLSELIRIFTSAFIKNMNLQRIVEVFEFELEAASVLSKHLLNAYVNYLVNSRAAPVVLEETLRSFLILISANLPEKGRYFHKCLIEGFSVDNLQVFMEALIGLTCIFSVKNHGFLSTLPDLSEKSRLSSQILTCLLLPMTKDGSNDEKSSDNPIQTVLSNINDLKCFALLVKYQAHILQIYPNNFSLNDLTVFVVLSNAMMNFCPNYRRFLLSKLDNEELVQLPMISINLTLSLYCRSLPFVKSCTC